MLPDSIVNSYFNKFLKDQNLSDKNESKNFEKFINYICLAAKNINNFNLVPSCVGDCNDLGIDGIAISINNKFIWSIGDLDEIIDKGIEFSVEFFFIQSKMSESFECKSIASFGNGVVNMFKHKNELKKIMNLAILEKYNMIKKIIDNYEYIKSKKCVLYYVTLGKYKEDDNLILTKSDIKDSILNLDMFEDKDIEIHIEDREFIRKQYELTRFNNTATFELNSKIEIPYTEKIDEAYLTIMSIKQYLEIVTDRDGELKKGIFHENVRDFMGIEDNEVNSEIVKTLFSDDREKFGFLNNGVTIVGKSLSKCYGKYTIRNFNIVNGCQTTHVLQKNSNRITDTMWISVKIVITQDSDTIDNITKGTNNQTVVGKYQFLSRTEYQKGLESFYNTYNKYTKLYYERRMGQYRGNREAESIKIVNLENQIRCFASVFLKEPHTASRNIGKLYTEVNKKLFAENHRYILYYTSALIDYKLEKLFINGDIDNIYYKYKYHMETIISHIAMKNFRIHPFNSKRMDQYCEMLIEIVEDELKFDELWKKAKICIDKVIPNLNDNESNRLSTVVNKLLIYSETEWSLKDISQSKYFYNMVDNYIVPFKKMSETGDRRYNFKNNLKYLKTFISDNKSVEKLFNPFIFKLLESKADFKSKDIRKEYSIKICDEVERVKSEIQKKIEIIYRYDVD